MEPSTNDEEAPKDPGAMKALTGMQDNDIFGELMPRELLESHLS